MRSLLLVVSCLGLSALKTSLLHSPAALNANLQDSSTTLFMFGLVVLAGAVLLPAVLGWLTHRVLRRRQPGLVSPGLGGSGGSVRGQLARTPARNGRLWLGPF